ncbi:RsmG family class I SAM-dependent methyltransferase [Chitinivibrio alkaliphilus]|uniref:Ribosomal RNA small subunit methyltransferase G n=1 Tax=Chitinivibrio alkaliphilus ACht1 TaxID=1313304 RepID=U7D6C7_9BACT|nr:RsmG family class I SAM-dependent methyltransferase [Chitinivibrio alkaliphilus]ERP31126.1 16S rRNA methyltransferase GidB [Chitinivibrio alkaliphilus ACht1]
MVKDLEQYVSSVKDDFKQKELDYLGLTPDDKQHDQILTFFCKLYEGIEHGRLTVGGDRGDIFIKHFCDSLQPLLLFGFGKESRMLDLDCEAGFPTIPTAIFRPDMQIVSLAEAEQGQFLREVIEACELTNVTVVDKVPGKKKFDYVVQRSNKTLQDLTRRARGVVRAEGRIYSFMTDNFHEELSEITMNKEEEGVSVVEIIDYDIADKVQDLNLVAFELYR